MCQARRGGPSALACLALPGLVAWPSVPLWPLLGRPPAWPHARPPAAGWLAGRTPIAWPWPWLSCFLLVRPPARPPFWFLLPAPSSTVSSRLASPPLSPAPPCLPLALLRNRPPPSSSSSSSSTTHPPPPPSLSLPPPSLSLPPRSPLSLPLLVAYRLSAGQSRGQARSTSLRDVPSLLETGATTIRADLNPVSTRLDLGSSVLEALGRFLTGVPLRPARAAPARPHSFSALARRPPCYIPCFSVLRISASLHPRRLSIAHALVSSCIGGSPAPSHISLSIRHGPGVEAGHPPSHQGGRKA
ncbi:uncharacterized protein PSFLO_03164 [Pseudozyma flocculosa]|uniref:Uncharacterized protein n=1 Tax=Pseudozyma flocculosa TaxID=84751 RepID=A0A5C3EZM8_9BASI|nr:uncharacterized protein PSFLO_03164 [Pseudozyma flocculosa]